MYKIKQANTPIDGCFMVFNATFNNISVYTNRSSATFKVYSTSH